jgi:glutamate-1-semialdehyde 2,1-aminomutase
MTNRPHEGSARLFERMARVMPAGSTRTTTFYEPFPIAIERGDGYRLWDVDGNDYIDLLANYTAHVHGHAVPAIVAAVDRAMRSGSAHPAPLVIQAELAERICSRVPSVEKVRFTNSGNEAVMVAVRAARALTGREKLVKAIGGYHGSWEQVAIGSSEDEHLTAGDRKGEPGIPAAIAQMLHSVRYNDIAHLETTMSEHGQDIAAILLEPVLGHIVEEGSAAYLRRARELADEHGALLILDEVITLRLHEGGVQSVVDVTPDLTTMAKVIGGGLPVGAVGGSDASMSIFDPRNASFIEHHGTFNGNAPTMAAGCVSLDLLPQSEIDRINALGSRLAAAIRESLAASPLDLSLTSSGSIMNLRGDVGDLTRLYLAALDAGIYMAPRGMLCVSTAMDDGVIDDAISRIDEAIVVVTDSMAVR